MAITPEGRVKAKVRALLQKYNVYYFMPATGGYGRSGIPDIVACANGRFVAIECKAGNNVPTALQERELNVIAAAGGYAICVNEEGLDRLEESIKRLTSSHRKEEAQ